MPLEAHVEGAPDNCVVRIPLMKQEVTVEKQTFVVERASIRWVPVQDVERIHDTLRAEELRTETEGDLEVAPGNEAIRPREDR